MVWQVKIRAVKPDSLGSIPGTHTIKGENWLYQVVLRPLRSIMACVCALAHTLNTCNLKRKTRGSKIQLMGRVCKDLGFILSTGQRIEKCEALALLQCGGCI